MPQLQRTFIKSLSETSILVRAPARRCLNLLILLQTRLDPLVIELTTGIKSSDDRGVKEAMWEALNGLLINLATDGRDINDSSKKTIETLILDAMLNGTENDGNFRFTCFSHILLTL